MGGGGRGRVAGERESSIHALLIFCNRHVKEMRISRDS